jgi:hypothetical protein
MKASLQDAIDLKLAKEGEVSILRKSIERVRCSHQIFTNSVLIEFKECTKPCDSNLSVEGRKRESGRKTSSNAEGIEG